ncbi:YqgQ family protein [Alteribacillus sp. YIM 98480]|uniref:YqgQ family protein n=1 Tax=Alteribacillus sp. YIM 98480 TaxID=2606599 RepID=UPI002102327D|nr:YqgQ family protein [Alteribacillus sp. YIM 98480]
MNSISDIRKWLMQFRTIVYTKDRQADLELMEAEMREAHQMGVLSQEMYQKAMLILRREKSALSDNK